jgi:hypothetical protein
MKSPKVFQMALKLLLIMILTTACSPPRPKFQSDEQIKISFQRHKIELIALRKKCELKREKQAMKKYIDDFFTVCNVNKIQLKNLNLEEVALEYKEVKTSLKKNNDSRILFVSNQYIDNPVDTFVEEKGYMFSAVPIANNLIEKDSLDKFNGVRLLERKKSEIWKYKEIEPNWYIYYRQYFYTYLG